MRRPVLIAVLVLLLVPTLWSQMRGGGLRGMGVRGGFAHGSGFAGRGSGFFPGGHGHIFPRAFPNNGFFFGNRFFFPRNRFFFSAGFGFPFGYAYPPYYYAPQYYYSAPPYGSYDDSSAEDRRRLEYDIERLNDQVDALRQEQAQLRRGEQPGAALQSRPTLLVFNDKRTEEVANYAIVGQTLWVFDEKAARKIALADLDLNATTRLNEERGVTFRLPTAR